MTNAILTIIIYSHLVIPGSQLHASTTCPSNIHWSDDGLERDLYIETATVTVLAMDGRRRWLDVQKLVSYNILPMRYQS